MTKPCEPAIGFISDETHDMGVHNASAVVSYYANLNRESPSECTWFVPGCYLDEPATD